MSKKIIKLYRELLDTADLFVTDDDCVSMKGTDKHGKTKYTPLTIKSKRLVLPTAEHMKNPNWEDRVAFHPLSENIARGESEVMERYRAALNIRLNTVLPLLMIALLRIGSSQAEHQKLNPDQSEFLSYVKNADQKTIDDFEQVLDKMPFNTPTKQFVSVFVKRSAKIDDVSYFRGGIVSFPFYNELKAGRTVHGVELRKKDQTTLLSLLNYILPHQDETNYYSRGSDSRIAPTIDAVMKAVMAVAGPLNDLIERFELFLPENMLIPADWHDDFENLGALLNELRSMPMLAGNEGAVHDTKGTAGAPAVEQPMGRVIDQPSTGLIQEQRLPLPGVSGMPGLHAAPPVPSSSGKMTDLDALLRSNPMLAAQAGYPTVQQGNWTAGTPSPHAGRASPNNPVASGMQAGWNQPQQPRGWGQPQGWNNNQGGGGGFRSGI